MADQTTVSRRIIIYYSLFGLFLFGILYYLTLGTAIINIPDITIYYKILLFVLTIIFISFDNYPSERQHKFYSKFLIALFLSIPFLILIIPTEYSFIYFFIISYIYFTFSCYLYIKSTTELLKIESFLLFYFISACFISIVLSFNYFINYNQIFSKNLYLVDIEETVWLRFLFVLGVLSFIKAWTIKELLHFGGLPAINNYKRNLLSEFTIGFLYNIIVVKVFVNIICYFLFLLLEFTARTLFSLGLILLEIFKSLKTLLAFSIILVLSLTLIFIISKLSIYIPNNITDGNNWSFAFEIIGFLIGGLLACSFIKYIFLYGMQCGNDKQWFLGKSIKSTSYLSLFIWFLATFIGVVSLFVNKYSYSTYPFTLLFLLFVIISLPFALTSLLGKNKTEEQQLVVIPYIKRALNWKILAGDIIPYLSLIALLFSMFICNPKLYKNSIVESYINQIFSSQVEKEDFEKSNIKTQDTIANQTINHTQKNTDTQQVIAAHFDTAKVASDKILDTSKLLVKASKKQYITAFNLKSTLKENIKTKTNSCFCTTPTIKSHKLYTAPIYSSGDRPIGHPIYEEETATPLYSADLDYRLPNVFYHSYETYNSDDDQGALAVYTNCVDCDFEFKVGDKYYYVQYSRKKQPHASDLQFLNLDATDSLPLSIYNKNKTQNISFNKEIIAGQCLIIGIYVDKN